jgi:D-tyrosyl-tRNA(Tyr) deacylase
VPRVRALVQRVTEARVRVDGEVVGEIGFGLCVLVGVTHDDDERAATRLAEKVWRLRIFDDDAGVMNLAVADVGGQVLVVSQFTLYGDARKGRRPDFGGAAPYGVAEARYREFCDLCALALPGRVQTGEFGARMEVGLVNDGPVTLWLER